MGMDPTFIRMTGPDEAVGHEKGRPRKEPPFFMVQ